MNDESNSLSSFWRPLGIAILSVSALSLAGYVFSWIAKRNPDDNKPAESAIPNQVNSRVDTDQLTQIHVDDDASTASNDPVSQLVNNNGPDADGWSSEVTSQHALVQLKRIAKWIETKRELPPEELSIANSFKCDPLYPEKLTTIFKSRRLHVSRATKSAEPKQATAAEFAEQLAALTNFLGTESTRRVHVKVIESRLPPQADSDHRIKTRVLVEASGTSTNEIRQFQATWDCFWEHYESPNANQPLRLCQIQVHDFEEAKSTFESGSMFKDDSKAVIGHHSFYSKQVGTSIPHWRTTIPKEFIDQFGHHGLAVADVNNDGLDDIYVCDAGGLPNRLYVQQPDGTADDVAAQAGVDFLDNSVSALFIDFDNDGDQDLAVGTDAAIHLAENDGKGKFTFRTQIALSADLFSMCAADYDNDGRIDLFACGYDVRKSDPTTQGLPFPFPYHDANNGGENSLLKNQGDFQFINVTLESGISQNNRRFSLAASWEDFDNDGDQDLYVANDFGRNNLYRNDNGKFVDIAESLEVQDQASGMSVSWADYNRDGQLDLYVGNMFSSAGNRITRQSRFGANSTKLSAGLFTRMARGNSLFKNSGLDSNHKFTDVSEAAKVNQGRWAWASKFVDLQNDGWPDLIVSNGYLTNEKSDDL